MLKRDNRDFSGGLAAKTAANAGGPGSSSGQGTRTLHAAAESLHAIAKRSHVLQLRPCTAILSNVFNGKKLWLIIRLSCELYLQNHSVKTWRTQWHSTPVLLPGKSYRRRSLVGCSPWVHEESDRTEQLHFHFSLSCIGEGNGNPLQCSCLENPRDGGAWWAAVCGVEQSRTRLKRLSSSSSIP